MHNAKSLKGKAKLSILLITALCSVFITACISKMPETGEKLYGNYAFERLIYMNPLSSFLVTDDYKEYYILSDDSLTVRSLNGNQRAYPIVYKKVEIERQAFADDFLFEDMHIPDMASCSELYQLTEDTETNKYRIYQVDNELWLANVHTGKNDNTKSNTYIWSIFEIRKFEGEFPVKYSVYGKIEGVDDFLALLGSHESMYAEDTCYNITPDLFEWDPDFQIYKFDGSGASYLLYEEQIYPLGGWFGGLGVTSFALADLNGDGKHEMYFTYSWGSGIHRSHVAYFDPACLKTIEFSFTHMDGDILVSFNNRNGGLSLYTANITNFDSFTDFDIENVDLIGDILFLDEEIQLEQYLGE